MVMTISLSKARHRFDSDAKPVINGSGATDTPRLFIRNHLYQPNLTLPFEWSPLNRTDRAEISIRDTSFWAWTLSSGITRNAGINRFAKTGGGDGFTGAIGSSTIASGNCSIEGKPVDTTSTQMICLQSGSSSLIFNDGNIEHALVFGANGVGQIYELGELKEDHTFDWATGDRGIVELYANIVRYYKISASGVPTLLRSTRSKMVYPVIPALMIYSEGAAMENVALWFGGEAKATLQTYGVLENFQNWQNKATWDSLAVKTTNKDKSSDFTYFSKQKRLKSLSIGIDWDEGDAYRNFLKFHEWHDVSKEFIFYDAARNDEFFARFITAFSDNPLGADTFGMAVDVQEIINPPNKVGLVRGSGVVIPPPVPVVVGVPVEGGVELIDV